MQMIQIAGIKNLNEAQMLVNAGVNYLGFPLRLPVNEEDTTEAEAKNIIKTVPGNIHTVLITYIDRGVELLEFCRYLSVDTVQIHGNITAAELALFKKNAPEIAVIKSLVVRESNMAELKGTILELSKYVDFFITDTFNPETGATGATGKTHDWEISRQLVKLSQKPVILAGGLTHLNVKEAILKVRPAGVDSHTGVEDERGMKDPLKVMKFVSEAEDAFRKIG